MRHANDAASPLYVARPSRRRQAIISAISVSACDQPSAELLGVGDRAWLRRRERQEERARQRRGRGRRLSRRVNRRRRWLSWQRWLRWCWWDGGQRGLSGHCWCRGRWRGGGQRWRSWHRRQRRRGQPRHASHRHLGRSAALRCDLHRRLRRGWLDHLLARCPGEYNQPPVERLWLLPGSDWVRRPTSSSTAGVRGRWLVRRATPGARHLRQIR